MPYKVREFEVISAKYVFNIVQNRIVWLNTQLILYFAFNSLLINYYND